MKRNTSNFLLWAKSKSFIFFIKQKNSHCVMFIGHGGKTWLIALRIKAFFLPSYFFSNFFFIFKDSDKTALLSLCPHLRKILPDTSWERNCEQNVRREVNGSVSVADLCLWNSVNSCDSFNIGAHWSVYKPAADRGHPHDHLMIGTV